jgi:demethylmenaquinone methyltransferase/2-methoxy-6-polyprenyl-1,4-benzoquinol methylase
MPTSETPIPGYRSARAQLDKQPAQVAEMFDQVAERYDLVNDVVSLGQDRLWRRQTAFAVGARPGELILDLAAGTGTSSEPFREAGAQVVPTDLSFGMLQVGKQRHPDWGFINADGLRLPFADAAFDAVTISFGLRNVSDTGAALRELRRVTKPGGRIVICEFSTPVWWPVRAVYQLYLKLGMPIIARLTSSNPEAYDYLTESIIAWPPQPQLAALLADAGWRQVRWLNLSAGIVALHKAVA